MVGVCFIGDIMEYVIGVDIGMQSIKVLLVDWYGMIVVWCLVGYQFDMLCLLWVEQWLYVWFDVVFDCIGGCVSDVCVQGVLVDVIWVVCVSSLYGGLGILVDSDMWLLYLCLIWMDWCVIV